MLITRYLREDGMPAYLTLSKEDEKGVMGIVRLVYPNAQDFARLWAKGDGVPVSIVAVRGI
jgi:hypothetical protein